VTTPQWLVAWTGDERSSVLEVTASGAAATAVAALVPRLVDDGVAGGIARQGWVEVDEGARDLVDEILELREDLRAEGINRVVLCGSGDLVLGPEMIARTAGVPLTVLDGSDPDQVRRALTGSSGTGMARTVVVLSGLVDGDGGGEFDGTLGTDALRRAAEAAFTAAGVDPRRRIVVVTDPRSALRATAEEAGYRRVFLAAPHTPGRFAALTAFGLVPAGLAGADLIALLDDASAVSDLLAEDAEGNPALVLGAAIAGTDPLRRTLVLVDEGSGLVGFCDWAEQLIAGSLGTGADPARRLLPVPVEGPDAPEAADPPDDALVVRLVAAIDENDENDDEDDTLDGLDADAPVGPAANGGHGMTVAGPLGSQLLLWEYAVAVAGRILRTDPFLTSGDRSTGRTVRAALDAAPDQAAPDQAAPDLVDGAIEISATAGLLGAATDLDGVLAALVEHLGPGGSIAVTAYLDRDRDASLAGIRRTLSARSHRPVTFGWAARARDCSEPSARSGSTIGVHLLITGVPDADLEIPGLPYTFGRLNTAQAAGAAQALADHGRPVLRLHLTDRRAGLAQLAAALEGPALTTTPTASAFASPSGGVAGGSAGPHRTEGASA
jgi:glucose-6-phosphate isomerase